MTRATDKAEQSAIDLERALNDMTESEYNNHTLWGHLDELYEEAEMESLYGEPIEEKPDEARLMFEHVPAPRAGLVRRWRR